MTAELGEWLTDLGGSDPATAAEVGASLVAVLQSADPSGLDIVGEPLTPTDPRETADYAYQLMLEELQHLRRRVSEVATSRKLGDMRLSADRAAGADAARLGELERDLAAARQREEVLTQQSERLQQQVDSFRTAKESAKAIYTSAEAQVRIAEAMEAAGGEHDADLAQLTAALKAARERMEEVSAQGVATQHRLREQSGQSDPEYSEPPAVTPPGPPAPPPAPSQPAPTQPVPGLLELRADPLGSDIRIMFAEEPAETVTLLAVLESPEAVSEHGAEAIRLASDLLTEIRDAGWPADLDEIALGDSGAFVARLFPADDGSITRRARVLAVMVPFASLRAEQHMSIAELADRSGVAPHRIEAIEQKGLGTALVQEAVALSRALGAQLKLPAGQGPVAG
jgi:phage shock protein A